MPNIGIFLSKNLSIIVVGRAAKVAVFDKISRHLFLTAICWRKKFKHNANRGPDLRQDINF